VNYNLGVIEKLSADLIMPQGLGTSDSNEAKEYFGNLQRHRKTFVWENDKDGDAIELAFSKKKIEARKDWLREDEV